MIVSFQQLVFYSLATLAIFSSTMVVLSKQAVRSVLFLVFSFFCMAGIWMLLEAEFLAIVLVLVYVGAVMVLFLFVVMMLDMESPLSSGGLVKRWPLGLLITALLLGALVMALQQGHFGLQSLPAPVLKATDYSNVKILGSLLYQDYLFAFEIAGIILFVALVAAIGIAFRGVKSKRQTATLQIQTTKAERLKIIQLQTPLKEEIA